MLSIFLIFTKITTWLLFCVLNLGYWALHNSSKRKIEDHIDYMKNVRNFKHIYLLVLHISSFFFNNSVIFLYILFILTFLQKHEKSALTIDNHLDGNLHPSIIIDDIDLPKNNSSHAPGSVPCIPCTLHPCPLLGPIPTGTFWTLPSIELL